jgi:hypothetical protein
MGVGNVTDRASSAYGQVKISENGEDLTAAAMAEQC